MTVPWRVSIGLASLCAIVGVLTFYSTATWLLGVWRTNDLKSVGFIVPFISFALILRAWREVGWETEGTWWGLALLAGSASLVFLRDRTTLVLIVHKTWLVQLPPVPLLAILYALSMVLLFGGLRLLRAAWFPVLFMGAVLPVPETFSRVVDLPLQHASATVARAFAHFLGERLTVDNLSLMFTPDFGMFIAPGCNGIRGAVTLGLAAVVIAYLYRFRWRLFAPVVLGAALLGYLFNFLRLCLLVVYYRIALPYPWLQDHAKAADYVIGGCLFTAALYLFFAIADRLKREPGETRPVLFQSAMTLRRPVLPLLGKVSAVLAMALLFGWSDLQGQREVMPQSGKIPAMPAFLGGWELVRTYRDTLATGVVVYQWGDYKQPETAEIVQVGISPELDAHDVEVCHLARGEDPVWHGRLIAQTAGGEAAFVAATYNDGQVQTLEASTTCDAGGCRQYTNAAGGLTFVYAYPQQMLRISGDSERPLPMLLKATSSDLAVPPEVAEERMAATLQAFLRTIDLRMLAGRFRAG